MSSQKSQIRDSQITALLTKVRDARYSTYLRSVQLTKIRGFAGSRVNFDFPVTALVGPNGGGKSTVLGAAACAYKEIKPGLFFPKSSVGDNSMSEWLVEYELIDKKLSPATLVRRSSTFRQSKWVRGEVASRPLAYFGIKRTLPAGERTEFKKLMRPSYAHHSPLMDLSPDAAVQIEHILGRSVKEFQKTAVGTSTFHVGKNQGNAYSEFHFGAGESSIIRIVTDIEQLPEGSLVLIEELENGLHPVATCRLVEYLVDAAERRRLQAIFTTHSDDALRVLPSEAIWSCFNGQAQQGKLSVRALRALSGQIDKALVIFTEDDFGKFIVEALIREFIPEDFDQIEVHDIAGDGNAVKTHKARALDPSAKNRSLCILDGDSQEKDAALEGILRLPGQQPEEAVFSDAQTRIDKDVALLTVSLQLAPTKQSLVKSTINSASATNRDRHVVFSQIGIDLGWIPEDIVRGAFVTLWIRNNADKFGIIVETIRSEIAKYRQTPTEPAVQPAAAEQQPQEPPKKVDPTKVVKKLPFTKDIPVSDFALEAAPPDLKVKKPGQ